MALLNKLKSILGIGGRDDEPRTETEVTVEQKADESTSDEADPVAAGTDAAASTGSLVDSDTEDPDVAAEPAEAAGTVGEEAETDDPVADKSVESTDESVEKPETAVDEAEAEADEGKAVEANEPAEEQKEDAGDAVDDEPVETDDDSAAEDDTAVDDKTDDEPTESDGDDDPVDSIKGIGPAYAERLAGAGITSISALAAADPEELADEIDVSKTIVGRWVNRAKDR